ncbi:hypothetical protein ACTU6U_00880 [Microbacterium sp. A196]|uniref:hypothetical protein n=1 Tax=Microbacterium sp. A196 TaxID=3457320 RepID=UPI003FD02C15
MRQQIVDGSDDAHQPARPRFDAEVDQRLRQLRAHASTDEHFEDLRGVLFAIGMFLAGAALGLLASQLGNVNMSSVTEEDTSEVGGLQGVFQNLGSSLGTALIGSILIGALSTSFAAGVTASNLPSDVRETVIDALLTRNTHRARDPTTNEIVGEPVIDELSEGVKSRGACLSSIRTSGVP